MVGFVSQMEGEIHLYTPSPAVSETQMSPGDDPVALRHRRQR